MAYPQVIIPPSVRPVSPLELTLQDDLTVPFQPRFARGTTQRQSWGDPVWAAQVRFEGMSGADRALLKAAIMGARGGAANIRMTPGIPLRGSFPVTELISNNDFSNGTTGWAAQYCTLSVADRTLRLVSTANSKPNNYAVYVNGGIATSLYAPYAFRGFFRGSVVDGAYNGTYVDSPVGSNYALNGAGMFTQSFVALTTVTGFYPCVMDGGSGSVSKAGDTADVYWSSGARCILADCAGNLLAYSNGFENSSPWQRTGVSNVTSGGVAPDGTSTSRSIIEDTSTGGHYIVYSITGLSSGEADYTFSFHAKGTSRDYGYIEMAEVGGSTFVYSYFDLTDGSWDSESTGAGWSNLRKHVQDCGNGWYRFTITARKTSSATRVDVYLGIASAVNTGTYTGDGASYMEVWGASLWQSSVPVRYTPTTTSTTNGTSQTSNALYVKGLPASTSGLLLAGDFIEVNGELMQCIAGLTSDAAGLGVLQMHRRPSSAIADNVPIIVNNPFGTFRLASDPRITERFGVYTDVDLQLIEALP